jgi:hypothetical protein
MLLLCNTPDMSFALSGLRGNIAVGYATRLKPSSGPEAVEEAVA